MMSRVTTQERGTWPPVIGALAIWGAVLVLSTLTSLIPDSPIHSDSWWPLLAIWGIGLALGLGLLVARRWAWGAAWTIGTFGGGVTYAGGVMILLVAGGS
jgi:hypothetical protein